MTRQTLHFIVLKELKRQKKDKISFRQFINVGNSISSKIGYDKAAKIAKTAHKNGTTLKQEVIKAGLIKEKEYDKLMSPIKMTKPR